MEKPLPAWSRRPLGRGRRLVNRSLSTTTTTTLPQITSLQRGINDNNMERMESKRLSSKDNFSKGFHGARQTDRNITFIQEQHQRILSSLYSEIQDLKAENKDLKFRLIMLHARPAKAPESAYEQELKATKLMLEESKEECHRLRRTLEEQEAQQLYGTTPTASMNVSLDASSRKCFEGRSSGRSSCSSTKDSYQGSFNLPAINNLNI